MRFAIDIHLHSRYAYATSRDLNPENLYRWSALKGLGVVGTGDFTHPAWLAELREKLAPAELGLLGLKDPWRSEVEAELPGSCHGGRFLLTTEISSIYKKAGRSRKVHNLVALPDFAAVETLNRRLGAIGNLAGDGRPILKLDCRDLAAICLESCPEAILIPAHIWTPHFSALGARSGFDSLEECFEDMLPSVAAIESGLSADPAMVRRVRALARFAVVPNADAHSPQMLGREATCFDTELSFFAIRSALQRHGGLAGTLEMYPEEGKYHLDGHRKCGVRFTPEQTRAAAGRCPACGRQLTTGVVNRIGELADRPVAAAAAVAARDGYERLVPLPEVVGGALRVGARSKRVRRVCDALVAELGPELEILRHAAPGAIERCSDDRVAQGITRMRSGRVEITPGYDGEYGQVELFEADG